MTTSTNWKSPARKAFAARAVPMNKPAGRTTSFFDSPAVRIGPTTATVTSATVPLPDVRSGSTGLERQNQRVLDKEEYARAIKYKSVRYVWRWDGNAWQLWAWSPSGAAAIRWISRRDKSERWRFAVTHGKERGPHWDLER